MASPWDVVERKPLQASADPWAVVETKPVTQEANFGERMLGSKTGRALLGASSLITGPFQLGANLGDKAADAILGEGGFRLGDWTNEKLAELEAAKNRGFEANGGGGFDAMGLGGAIVAGGAASKAPQVLGKALPVAKSMLGKIGQGGLLGGLFGASAPTTGGDDSYWGDKATQVGAGTVLGSAAPPVIAGLSKGSTYVGNLLDRFTDKGIRRIADREWMQHAGDDKSQAALVNALKNPKKLVKGSAPRASQVLADMPEGRPIIGVEKALSTMTVGPKGVNAPTVDFKFRENDQIAARLAAKVERNTVTDPMREGALDAANAVTQKFNDLGETVIDRFYSKAAALQTKGGFDTLESQMGSRANSYHPTSEIRSPISPLMEKIKATPAASINGKPPRPVTPVQSEKISGGHARVPGRYTPHAQVQKQAASASADTAPIIATRQAELSAAESELAALQATGAKPLEMRALQEKIIGLRDKPGNFSTDVVRKTMNSISEKIAASVEKFGKLDAKELYSIRKDIGKDIEAAMGPNAKPDKQFSAILERDIQEAIDESIEAAGGAGWKEYLNEFATRSQAIRDDALRSKEAKKVATEVTMGAFDNFTDQGGSGLPGLLNTKVALANAVIRGAGKRAVPKVAAEMTKDALNPQQLAAALERQIALKGKSAATEEFIRKYGRGAVQNALAVQLGKE